MATITTTITTTANTNTNTNNSNSNNNMGSPVVQRRASRGKRKRLSVDVPGVMPQPTGMQKGEPWVWLNGVYCRHSQATIPVIDYGFNFGASVYDVIWTENGTCFQLDKHLDRILGGCKTLGIHMAMSHEELSFVCRDIIKLNAVGTGPMLIYMQISFGSYAHRSHMIPDAVVPNIVIFTQKPPIYDPQMFLKGSAFKTVEDYRWSRCSIKTCLLLPNIMEMSKCRKEGYQNVLFVDPEKDLVYEGGSCNLFVVKDNVVYTPPITSNKVLPGITRNIVIMILREAGKSVIQQNVTEEFLKNADEAFVTSTTSFVMPINRVDKKEIKNTPGPVTKFALKMLIHKMNVALSSEHYLWKAIKMLD